MLPASTPVSGQLSLTHRAFRRATGHTPIRYVQQLRVQRAKRMLARTREPVDEIAWRVGYTEPSAFRRLFKRVTKVSPGTYRRKMEVRVPYRRRGDR